MKAAALIAAAVIAAATSAAAQSTIRVGQTVNGTLSSSDARLEDGSYIDCYDLQTQAGQRLQIDQTAQFDSYLSITLGGCQNATEVLVTDDDSGGGLNSRIVRNGDGALWGVVANSIEGGVTGAYQLRVTAARGAAPAAPAAPAAAPSRPALPRVESTWAIDAMTCHAAYSSLTSMLAKNVAPIEYGNVARIDYAARARGLEGRMQGGDFTRSESYAGNFEMMALVGMVGTAPNGTPNGHRPLAEYLTILGNCDRAFSLTPVTAY